MILDDEFVARRLFSRGMSSITDVVDVGTAAMDIDSREVHEDVARHLVSGDNEHMNDEEDTEQFVPDDPNTTGVVLPSEHVDNDVDMADANETDNDDENENENEEPIEDAAPDRQDDDETEEEECMSTFDDGLYRLP